MSSMPSSHQTPSGPETEQAGPPPSSGRFEQLHRRVLGICLVTFALEIGLFLVVYPWTRGWALNFLPVRVGGLVDVWMSYSLRAAVSALGAVDMWIAGAEFLRLVRRRSPRGGR